MTGEMTTEDIRKYDKEQGIPTWDETYTQCKIGKYTDTVSHNISIVGPYTSDREIKFDINALLS